MRRLAWMFVLVGCGRISFEPGALDDARGDTASCAQQESTCGALSVGLCDGFEQAALHERWSVTLRTGTVDVDASRAYRGCSSLRLHTDAITGGNPIATIRSSQGFAGAGTGTLYSRAWIYFASPLPTIDLLNQLINFANDGGLGVSMGTRGGRLHSNDYTFLQSATSATTTPVDRWACLQLQIPDGTEGTSRVFLDGVELIDMRLTTPPGQPLAASDHIYFGLDWALAAMDVPAADAWLDEVIVDDQPVTCAQ